MGRRWPPRRTDDDDNENDENDNDNNNGLVECEDGSLVETEELCEQSETLVTCSDGSSAATQAECPSEPVSSFVTCSDGSSVATQAECPSISTAAVQKQIQTCQDGSVVSVNEACPKPETLTCPDESTVSVDEDCPPTDKPLPDCDGSFQDCKTQGGFVCPAGSAAHECEDIVNSGEEQELIDCNTYPENEYCNSEKGRDGLPFCDLVKNAGSCYDRNDNPEEYCSKYSNLDSDFCQIIKDKWCERNLLLKECYDNGRKEKGNNNKNGRSGSSSSSSSSSSKTTIINSNAVPNAAEVSGCRLDGNAHGIQQKFDSIKYQACGLYPNAQIAYTDGFVAGCTQVGNTQQLCQAFVVMNTQQTQTAATQSQTLPNLQPTTQPTQAIQTQSTTQPTQAIQPSDVS